ncbi:MAG: hypothetical protein GEU73_06400 [Chloroflexi bacterium]|nr:hypothetical protein [Chloroflexota bacterium]
MRLVAPVLTLAIASVAALVLALSSAPVLERGERPAEQILRIAGASLTGQILFGHAGDVWAAQGNGLQQLTQGGRHWGQPDGSPNGSEVALVGWGQSSTDIFVLDLASSTFGQLTLSEQPRIANNDWAFHPQWSPDGESIAFVTDRSSPHPVLWVMRSDGSNKTQLTPARSAQDAIDSFAWSPDGTQIAATRSEGSLSQIDIIDVAQPGLSMQITDEPGGAFDPTWSPDGQYVAFAAREGARTRIRVIDMTSGQATTLGDADTARSPTWSPYGGQVAYLALVGREFELFVLNVSIDSTGQLSAGPPAQLTSRFGADATSGLSWLP